MRILFLFLLPAFISTITLAQETNPPAAVKYGFVKGRSYLYTSVKRNTTRAEGDAEVDGDDWARTQVFHVCISGVDTAGSVDLVLSRIYDRLSGLDNPGVTGALKSPQDDVDVQLQVRLGPDGAFRSGRILKLSAELEEDRAEHKRNGIVRPRIEDSTLIRGYIEQLFPQLPPASSAPRASISNSNTPSECLWRDEKQRDVISTVTDSVAITGDRFQLVETSGANGDPLDRDTLKTMGICTAPGKCYISFDNRYFMRSAIRVSDGVPVEWRRNVRWTTASLVSKKVVFRYSSEEIVTLTKEEPCVP